MLLMKVGRPTMMVMRFGQSCRSPVQFHLYIVMTMGAMGIA